MTDVSVPPEGDETPGVSGEHVAKVDAEAVELAAPATCSTCGATLDADQTYCLECGAPTAIAPPLRKAGRRMAAVGGALLLLGAAAGAGTFALAKGADDGKAATASSLPLVSGASTQLPATTGSQTATATGTLPTDTTGALTSTASTDTSGLPPVVTGGSTVTGVSTSGTSTLVTDTSSGTLGATTVTETTPSTEATVSSESTESTESAPSTESTPDLGTPGGNSDWPSGKSGWTVQVSSVRSAAGARRLAKRIAASGQPSGVLLSSDYSTFKEQGYWVVFSGVYDTEAAARAQQATFGTAFGRTIIRKVAT